MPLTDLLPDFTPRPPGVTCERYVRGEGRRCAHYVAGGACALPELFRCTEWLKANPGPVAPPPPPRDLFGAPVAPKSVPRPPDARPVAPFKPPVVEPSEVRPPRGLTAEDIASFKALNVEVKLRSAQLGEVWIVPAYTGLDRRELTPEHLATLFGALTVFPGAAVEAFDPLPRRSTPTAADAQRKDAP